MPGTLSTIRQHCPYCDKETNCAVIAQETTQEHVESHLVGQTHYVFLKCCGCDEPFFIRAYRNLTEPDYDRHGNAIYSQHIDTFPSPESRRYTHHQPNFDIHKSLLQGIFEPTYLSMLYDQISSALNEGKNLLAALGMRSLIDAVSIDQANGNPQGGFAAHLELLVKSGLLPASQKQLFEDILKVGHGVTHRLTIPPLDQLKVCMAAIDHLLDGIYLQPKRAAAIQRHNIP